MEVKVLSKEEFMKRYLEDKKRKQMLERRNNDDYFYDSINRCKKRGRRR